MCPIYNSALILFSCILMELWTGASSTLQSSHGSCGSNSPRKFVRSTAPLVLDPEVSSEVTDIYQVRFRPQDCLMLCRRTGCLAVVITKVNSNAHCKLVYIYNSALAPGSPESHVHRVFGTEADSVVWMVDNFHEIINDQRLNITLEFPQTGTGSSGIIQQVEINATACYRIEVAGASGGNNPKRDNTGGKGAFIVGQFNLTAGTRLAVVVGQRGGDAGADSMGAGGGGGSFVYEIPSVKLLIAAGGGGGAGHRKEGQPGQAGRNGGDSLGPNAANTGNGGVNGQPGYNEPSKMPSNGNNNHGGCGAGWLDKPVNARRNSNDGGRGGSLADGWVGGVAGDGNTGIGGFGGGGGGGSIGGEALGGASGAGGGFSGGGAGLGRGHVGGGGGSFCGGVDCSGVSGDDSSFSSEQGRVVLRLASLLGCQ